MTKKILLIMTIFTWAFSNTNEQVIVIPGLGICLNNDTIFIDKTSSIKLLGLLNIKDIFGVRHRHWDGFYEDGKAAYGDEYVKNIIYKDIDFEFVGESRDSLFLKWIRIKQNKLLLVHLNDSILLGQTSPQIDKCFPKRNKYDYISDNFLTYNLYSYGISFQLDSIGTTRKLKEISVHYKIEETKK